jgi:ParB/RepB/Spo0J family partition protein
MGMNQSETVISQATITQVLKSASRAALEVIFDAAVFEEHLALTIDSLEDVTLETEVNNILESCEATHQGEGSYLFADLETLRCLMLEVTELLESEEGEIEPDETVTARADQTGEEEGFIVFNASSLTEPESLPDEDIETLELESKGYQLRKIPFSSIRIEPANNPRSRTARAGVVRLARNISKRGLQQPVTVRPIPESEDQVELVFGYRRVTAIGYAMDQGWLPKDHDVICVVRKLNDSQVRLAALSENEEREEVDLLDQAEGWAKLRLRQTENAIANAAGIPLASVKRCLKVAFGVCEEAKVLYREGKLDWNALTAFSYGSLLEQQAYLEQAAGIGWKLAAQYIKQAMTVTDFKLANARFSLEDYEAAGGKLETDLWQSQDGTRLLSRDVIERLQSAWAQSHAKELQARGFAFVEVRAGDWMWWSEFNRVTRGTENSGAIIHVRPDWSVDVIEWVMPNQASAGAVSGVGPNDPTNPNSSEAQASVKPEEPKVEFTEAGITLVRRTRTAALQQAILENTDPKLPLALAVMGFLGEREIRFKITNLGEIDAITSSAILAEFETIAATIPNLSFSPFSGLEFAMLVRHHPEKRLETLQALLHLDRADLERVHRLLIATMVGDFANATDGSFDNRRRKLGIDPLVSALAAHLNVKGGEALEASEDYLKTVGYRKNRLRPYIVQAFGEQLSGALLESPRAKIIAELVAHKDKLAGFTAPELDFAVNSSTAIKLEVAGEVDYFADDADSAPWEEQSNLLGEQDLLLELPGFEKTAELGDLEPAAADD